MGLSRTVIEINSDFSRKSQNFTTTLYFAPPLKGFPPELRTGARGQRTRMMGLPGRIKSLTISSVIWIQSTNVTDGHRTTAKNVRPYIASRGKNCKTTFSSLVLVSSEIFVSNLCLSTSLPTTSLS